MYIEILSDKIAIEDYRGMLKQCFFIATDGKPKSKVFDSMFDDLEEDEVEKLKKMITLSSNFMVSKKESVVREIIN